MQRVTSKRNASSTRKKILWGLVLVGIVSLIALSFRPVPMDVDVAAVTQGKLTVSVNEDGMTRIRERYTVSSPLAGRLSRITLKAGDPVLAKETILARLEPSDPQLLDSRARTEAEARVKAADAQAQRALAERERAESAQVFAQRDWERKQALHADGLIATAELQEAEYQAQTATADLKAAKLAVQIADHELEQARAALLHAQGKTIPSADEDDWRFPIPAPINGRVLRVFEESATILATGAPILQVGDPTDLEVVIDVLSTDAVKIVPGATVWLEHWGGPQALEGRVRLIEPAAFTKISALGVEEQRVWVVIDFVSPPEQRTSLGDGFRVEARIVIWEGVDLIKAPTGALFRQGEAWAVFVYQDDVAQLQRVVPGHSDGIETEILEGLEVGDEVILHPSERIEEGVPLTKRQ